MGYVIWLVRRDIDCVGDVGIVDCCYLVLVMLVVLVVWSSGELMVCSCGGGGDVNLMWQCRGK